MTRGGLIAVQLLSPSQVRGQLIAMLLAEPFEGLKCLFRFGQLTLSEFTLPCRLIAGLLQGVEFFAERQFIAMASLKFVDGNRARVQGGSTTRLFGLNFFPQSLGAHSQLGFAVASLNPFLAP